MTSTSKAAGRFSKADFIYIARDDEDNCPAGQRLRLRHVTEKGPEHPCVLDRCIPHVALRSKCTLGKERRVGKSLAFCQFARAGRCRDNLLGNLPRIKAHTKRT
jgi:hypothetical protein